jgi:4-hydroxybenzoate polyprenyltransferase
MKIRNYLSLVVFAHTIFAMPFALTGFFLAIRYAGYPFRWQQLVLVIACMVWARNAAMGFNRWADRWFDSQNPRTAGREIPTGIITGRSALLFSLVNALLFILTAAMLNNLCLYLSPVALLVVLGYSYTKRFTWLCHLILGLGLSLAPIGAYLAVTGRFDWLPLIFSGIVITWVGGFDIIYALQDEKFDRAMKLHSIPARIGVKSALGASVALHLVTAAFVILAGWLALGNWAYWSGALVFIILLAYQHLIVKPGNLSRVNRAFGTTNGIASLIYATFTIISLYLG